MAGDERPGEWLRRAAGALARELGCRRGPRCLGPPDRRAEGVAARGRRRGRRGARPLDARARRGDRRVADRPVRRRARAALARPLARGAPRGASRCASATTSRTTSPTRSRSSRPATLSGYVEAVESVVESFETRDGVPRGRAGRRHGARARTCSRARRGLEALAAAFRRSCPSPSRPARTQGGTRS